jgi:RNA polymerase sigma-70 factor, ECF subfamily
VTEALMELQPLTRDDAPPAELAEARLLRAFRAGDAAAFETLYDRQRGRIYGLAYRLTGGAAEAEELTQEVFVRVWEHRGKIQNGAHLARWLRRVAVNCWINHLRRLDPTGDDDEERLERQPGAPTAVPGVRLDLERAVAALPPRLRAVLLLFDLYGLSHEEVADHLEITAGASKVQLHRARTRLREMLR